MAILKEIDPDTSVHYLDIKNERIWEGIEYEAFKIIRCVNDPREITAIMNLYCPGWKVGTLAKLSKDDLDFEEVS